MAIRIYDPLTRQLQELPLPDRQPRLKIYVCGPTVYDDPHIGHARSAYVFDVIRRYLEYRGYQVWFVRNVTDVDDKIIQKARDTNQTVGQVSEQCLASYHQAMTVLGIQPPTEEPRATAHILQMQAMIKGLVRKEAAYVAVNGDVYFDVRRFRGYGKLSNRSVDELEVGARVESGEEKRDPLDFALWKAAKSGEPQWADQVSDQAPRLVPGRPGWHIECSAMSMHYLGETFDIHGGGVDLVFPHHENELAQSQAATGKPFARYWIHNGLLTINGQKMSKSLGNFVTVDDALQQCGGQADALKIFFLNAHYRSPIDYAAHNVEAAVKRLDGITSFLGLADQQRGWVGKTGPASSELLALQQEFEKAMDDDFHAPNALAVIDKLVTYGSLLLDDLRPKPGGTPVPPAVSQPLEKAGLVVLVADMVLKLGQVLGLSLSYKLRLTPQQQALVDKREAFRQQKKFSEADKIRVQLEGMGLLVADTAGGPVVRPKITHSS